LELLTVNIDSSHTVRVPQLWEAVAAKLRAAILDGSLPAGTKLVESELAERFGTSRGPVREAIRELAREGLVAELPRRGSVVSTMTARDLAEIYAIREGLELSASRAVVTRAGVAGLTSLEDSLELMEQVRGSGADYGVIAEHDFDFHRRLVSLAGNRRMAEINETMLTQSAVLLRLAAEVNPTLRSDLDRPVHQELVDALRARDLERAQRAVGAHYRYAEERLFAQFAGRPAS
jgi:DNA-binding GntR family transcriptional regulator